MIHLNRYWSMGASKLAADVGVSKSTISHLLRGKSNPLYSTASGVVKCLEAELGLPLDHEEVFSAEGSYPTPYVCDLVGCKGCNDERFFDADFNVRPECRDLERGRWSGDNFEVEAKGELERQNGEQKA